MRSGRNTPTSRAVQIAASQQPAGQMKGQSRLPHTRWAGNQPRMMKPTGSKRLLKLPDRRLMPVDMRCQTWLRKALTHAVLLTS